jgi:hypothetical protein
MSRRKARTPTMAPVPAIIESNEAEIEATVRGWHARSEKWHSSEGAYEHFYNSFLESLESGDPIYVASVVHAATNGHPAADHAIRRFFRLAAETRRVELFSSVLAYMAGAVERAPLPMGYASQGTQGLSDQLPVEVRRALADAALSYSAEWLLFRLKRSKSAARLVNTITPRAKRRAL